MSQKRPGVQSVVDADSYEVERTHDVEVVEDVDWHAACRWCRTSFDTKRQEQRHMCAPRSYSDYQADGRPAIIEPAQHEIQAKFLFQHQNMGNYWALVSQFDQAYEGEVKTFEFDGETWEFVTEEMAEAEYDEDSGEDFPAYTRTWEGGIAPRPQDKADDRLAEYQLKVRKVEADGPQERDALFQLKPSYPDMTHYQSGNPIKTIPSDLPEGLRVQSQSTNVDLEEIVPLLRATMSAIDVSTYYFEEEKIHEWSNIFSFAMYVRLFRDAIDGLTSDNGVLERIARYSSHANTKGQWKWDNRQIEAHHQSAVVCERGWQKLVEDQKFAKRVKPYHPERPRKSETDDDPLSSPKVEVQFVNDIGENEESVPWAARHELKREIDEALLNVLHWADISLEADANVYREDVYWNIQASQRDIAIFEDPTEKLKPAEEDLATAQFRANGWGQKEAMVALDIADGGSAHYEEIAERIQASVSTVYRAIEKASGVLTSDNGYVQFADRVIKDKMQQLSSGFRQIAEQMGASVEELVDNSQAVEFAESAFGAWMQRYGIAPGDGGDQLELDMADVERGWYTVKKLLREGYQAAAVTGGLKMGQARVQWRDHAGDVHVDPIREFLNDREMQDLRTAVATP